MTSSQRGVIRNSSPRASGDCAFLFTAFLQPSCTRGKPLRDRLYKMTARLEELQPGGGDRPKTWSYVTEPQHHAIVQAYMSFKGVGHPSQGTVQSVTNWVSSAETLVQNLCSAADEKSTAWILFGFAWYWFISPGTSVNPPWLNLLPSGAPSPESFVVNYPCNSKGHVYFLFRSDYHLHDDVFRAKSLFISPSHNDNDLVTVDLVCAPPNSQQLDDSGAADSLKDAPLLYADYLAAKIHFIGRSIARTENQPTDDFVTQQHHDISRDLQRLFDDGDDYSAALERLERNEARVSTLVATMDMFHSMLDPMIRQLKQLDLLAKRHPLLKSDAVHSLITAHARATEAEQESSKRRNLCASIRDAAGHVRRYREKAIARDAERNLTRITSLLTSLGVGLGLAEIFNADVAKQVLQRAGAATPADEYVALLRLLVSLSGAISIYVAASWPSFGLSATKADRTTAATVSSREH